MYDAWHTYCTVATVQYDLKPLEHATARRNPDSGSQAIVLMEGEAETV